VNILPGRDGLLHISKIGGGKRIDKVEDVLELGQSVDVVVEDIDPNGKVSLRMAGDAGGSRNGGGSRDAGKTAAEKDPESVPESGTDDDGSESVSMSFEDDFESVVGEEFGELGPEGAELSDGGGGRGRGRGSRGNRGGGRNSRR
jgi:polyribonucleotide nucleotidyltransferase